MSRIPDATQQVLNRLKDQPALHGAIFIGGTALAVHIDHRTSFDIDLCYAQPNLPPQLLSVFKALGAKLTTSQAQIVQARINGWNLLTRMQEWSLDGVKLQIFADPDMPKVTTAPYGRMHIAEICDGSRSVCNCLAGRR